MIDDTTKRLMRTRVESGALPWNWNTIRIKIFDRDGYACVICGSRKRIECDHIVPRHQQGSNRPENLQTLCRECHLEKTRCDKGYSVMDSQLEWMKFATMKKFERRKLLLDNADI